MFSNNNSSPQISQRLAIFSYTLDVASQICHTAIFTNNTYKNAIQLPLTVSSKVSITVLLKLPITVSSKQWSRGCTHKAF